MKKIAFLLAVLLLFTVIPVQNTQGISLDELPMPYNLQSGVVYMHGMLEFVFNNGYLNVWQKGGDMIYQFEWEDGWKEYKIIDHVIADLTICIKSQKRVYKDDSVKLTQKDIGLKALKCRSLFIQRVVRVFIEVFETHSVKTYKPVFVKFNVVKNVRMFVRNKVPSHNAFLFTKSLLEIKPVGTIPAGFIYKLGGDL